MTTPISAADLKATGRSRRRLVKNKIFEVVAVLRPSPRSRSDRRLVGLHSRCQGADLNFFTRPAVFGQSGGGIAPALVGTLILVGIATAWPCRSAS